MWKKDIIGLRTVVKLEIYEVGSCSLQGLIVHPGVVDQDCKGEPIPLAALGIPEEEKTAM